MPERICVGVMVHGHVQGVWFRSWTVEEATKRSLGGWVRNRADGRVEAVLCGEKDSIDTMIKAMREGPPEARVDQIEIEDNVAEPPPGFVQRPTL